MVNTRDGTCPHIIKTECRQTARRQNENGAGVKVVSGQLERLTDGIISYGDGRMKVGDDTIKTGPSGHTLANTSLSDTTILPPLNIHHPWGGLVDCG